MYVRRKKHGIKRLNIEMKSSYGFHLYLRLFMVIFQIFHLVIEHVLHLIFVTIYGK